MAVNVLILLRKILSSNYKSKPDGKCSQQASGKLMISYYG